MTKTNLRKRAISILLILMVMLTMTPMTASAAATGDGTKGNPFVVTNYEDWVAAMQQSGETYIKLGANIDTAELNSGIGLLDTLAVKGQKQLDLNGHTLRLFTQKSALGDLIEIKNSSLTLSDSSAAKTGRILGVTSGDADVLINVWENGKFTMNSGKLEVEVYTGSIRGVLWRRTIDCHYDGEVVINGGTLYVPPKTYEDSNAYTTQFFDEFDDMHNGSCGYTLIANNNSKVTINGGTFQGPVRMNVSNSKWNKTTSRVIITGGTFEKDVVLNGAGSTTGDGKVTLAEIKGGTFLGKVQAWAAASFESSFSTPEVVISGGEFSKEFWLRPKFPLVNNKEQRGVAYQVAAKLNGGTFHEGFSADKNYGNYEYSASAVKQRLEAYEIYQLADKLLGQNAIQTGNGTFAAQDSNSYNKYITNYRKSEHDSGGYAFIIKAVNSQPTKILPNAWGMESVTLDDNPINYAKDWKGGFEELNNDKAHTLKFTWKPLALGLSTAGYSYRAECDRYLSGSTTPTTDTISDSVTEYSYTIPAGADPKVYSFALHLNLKKTGSPYNVGIYSNEHIVKLVLNEAPAAPPTLSGKVYYTSGIVYNRPISTGTSDLPTGFDSGKLRYQWQRSTDGGSTWKNINSATSGSYIPVAADMDENVRIRVKVTAEGYLGEIVGAAVKVSKATNNNYPEVIKLEAVQDSTGTYTGFEIKNFDSDCEYVYSTTDTPNWSANQISSATVTGLTSDTTYYVFARFKETATHTAGSIVSKNSIKLYDNVPLWHVSLEGYDSGNTIYIKQGESVTLKVSADPINANSWKEITFKERGTATGCITVTNGKINATTGTAIPFPNDHTITITGNSVGSTELDASYSGSGENYYGRWNVVVYNDSTVANALRLENVYAYEDITLSVNDEAKLPTEFPKLLPEGSGYHLEWRILKGGTSGGYTHVTENGNIKLEDGKIKPRAAHAASGKTQLELVAVKDNSDEYKTLPKKSLFYVTVTAAPTIALTGITVAPTKVNLDIGNTITLSAVKQPVNADGILSWASDKPEVAEVESTTGKVTAKTQGIAKITATCDGKSATCTVTVGHTHDYNGQPYLYLDPGSHYQECKAGDSYSIEAHDFGAWIKEDDTNHSRTCSKCNAIGKSTNYSETAAHTWVWVVDTPAEAGVAGVKHEKCTGCNATRNVGTVIPALPNHAASGGGSYAPTTQKPEITIIGSGKAELSADGKTATITAATGYELTSVVLNGKEMGKVEKLTGLKTGDKVTITFRAKAGEKDGKEETDKMIAREVSKLRLTARSARTAKKNIKLVVKSDLKAITDAGYTVKYKFYRSTKKTAGYKAVLTKKAPTYVNTYGKKGTLYYYKVKVMVYDKDGNLIAQTALKQCKYASRLWTK